MTEQSAPHSLQRHARRARLTNFALKLAAVSIGVAALALVPRRSDTETAAAAEHEETAAIAAVAPAPVVRRTVADRARKPAAPKAAKHTVRSEPAPAAVLDARVPEALDAGVPAVTPAPPVPAPIAASDEAVENIAPGAVTVTGCLEMNLDNFRYRLTDIEGDNVPKARSWRTGFLAKRPASVALVAAPYALELKTHVGQRVAATGLLNDRQLRPSLLRVVSRSCDE